jgi:hypothetical protein
MSQDNQILSNEAPKARAGPSCRSTGCGCCRPGRRRSRQHRDQHREGRRGRPDLAAIKFERDAFAAYCAPPKSRRDEKPPRGRHKAYASWWARQLQAEKTHTKSAQDLWSAREAFLQTQPTTIAGLLAYLDHIEGPLSTGDAGEAFWDEEEHKLAFPTLAAAARNLIARGQA